MTTTDNDTGKLMSQDTEQFGDDNWYPSVTEKRMREGPLIQRLGSFYPRKRRGYSASKTEQRIQKRTAGLLYDKRIAIARRIVSSRYKKTDEILNDALINSGIAPNSVEGWKDYVVLISEREGGWDIFRNKLETQIHFLEDYQKSIIVGWATSLLACLLSFASPLFLGPIIGDSWVSSLLYGIILGIAVIVVVVHGVLNSGRIKPMIREVAGPAVRDPDAFVTAESVQSML